MTGTTKPKRAKKQEIDQRSEIAENVIEISVTMPGQQPKIVKIDASAPVMASKEDVVNAAAELLMRLLEA